MKTLLSCPPTTEPRPGPPRGPIEAHLEEVLASRHFRGSRRACAFLRYITAEEVAGRGQLLKERNIAIDVFQKSEQFDAQHESIVRVNAADVRKRLAQFYEENPASSLAIELPVGCYQPIFHEESAPPPEKRPVGRLWFTRFAKPLAGAIALCVSAWALTRNGLPRETSPEDLLWAPFAASNTPVLVSLPAPAVYQFTAASVRHSRATGEAKSLDDLRSRESFFVGTGAAYGAARFAEQLSRRGQTFVIKFGNDVTFADLKQGPALLLGAYTSFWTMEMTRGLTFRIEQDGDSDFISDTLTHQSWRVANPDTVDRSEGYALVTRLLKSETGHPLIMAAGMTPRDTQASVEFLTNPANFNAFAASIASSWPTRNFQVVLHCYVHGHSPGAPTVVASRIW